MSSAIQLLAGVIMFLMIHMCGLCAETVEKGCGEKVETVKKMKAVWFEYWLTTHALCSCNNTL
jgi:hypothetical protein